MLPSSVSMRSIWRSRASIGMVRYGSTCTGRGRGRSGEVRRDRGRSGEVGQHLHCRRAVVRRARAHGCRGVAQEQSQHRDLAVGVA